MLAPTLKEACMIYKYHLPCISQTLAFMFVGQAHTEVSDMIRVSLGWLLYGEMYEDFIP